MKQAPFHRQSSARVAQPELLLRPACGTWRPSHWLCAFVSILQNCLSHGKHSHHQAGCWHSWASPLKRRTRIGSDHGEKKERKKGISFSLGCGVWCSVWCGFVCGVVWCGGVCAWQGRIVRLCDVGAKYRRRRYGTSVHLYCPSQHRSRRFPLRIGIEMR